ncbi:MAG: DUF1365 domain-containing protein [Planctomycetota bacterium]
MHSCIYQGWVRHRRFRPADNRFRYSVFQLYLDLNELETVFAGSWLFSTHRTAPAQFCREDHLGSPERPLADCVREEVERQTGNRPGGPIRLLTNLRYFGYVINPVSYYYCFNESGSAVQHVLAEVHNTPWGERHCYVLPAPLDPETGRIRPLRNRKDFHVSPFMQMNMEYHWRMTEPGDRLFIHIENHQAPPEEQTAAASGSLFDVTMRLVRRKITPASLRRLLLFQPCITAKVAFAIYWQALRLWWKQVPFVPHPGRQTAAGSPHVEQSPALSDQPG